MAGVSRKNRKAILGRKVGMTQIFSDEGSVIPVTVLEAGPCAILQIKTEERDGYRAYQLAFGERRKPAKQPQQAVFERLGVAPTYVIREVPFIDEGDVVPPAQSSEDAEGAKLVPGATLGVGAFREIPRVDIQGVTKGRGFAGTIKRHNFRRGRDGHGSKNVREPGSTGQHTDPGRVFKGKKMPGQHGAERRKIRNLEVVRIDEENHLLVVKGAVPGPNGGYVYIEESLSQS